MLQERVTAKGEIAKLLEKEAKAPRARKFKLSQPLARYFTYLITKYKDDYKVRFRKYRTKIFTFAR